MNIPTKITKEKILENLIYRRVITVAALVLHEIMHYDALFAACEEIRGGRGYEYCEKWDRIIESVLIATNSKKKVYPEQYEYMRRFVTITIMSIFGVYFDKLQENKKEYQDPVKLVAGFSPTFVDSIFAFDSMYRNDFGDVREDVPHID